jgi:hypothetical protein
MAKNDTGAKKSSAFRTETILNMAQALNEIRIDFELPDEHLDREAKIKVLKDIRNDLIKIYWNYKLVKRDNL